MNQHTAQTLLHLGTRIQVVFSVPDGQGNAGQGIPINLELQKLDKQTWDEAFTAIQQEKAKLVAQLQAALPAEHEHDPTDGTVH